MIAVQKDKYGNKWIDAKLPIRIYLKNEDPRIELTEEDAAAEGAEYLMEVAQSNDGDELLANGKLEF